MSADILLGQSYYLQFDPKLWDGRQPFPPLGTMIAANVVRQNGYDVAFFDAMLANSETEWQLALEEYQPQYAVIYEDNFNYLSKMCLLRMRQAAFTMIEMARQQGCKVIVAGSDATDHSQSYLSAGADFVLLGEGVATLVELIQNLDDQSNSQPFDVPGLAFMNQGEYRLTAARPVLKQIDELPFPAWDLIDVEKYKQVWYGHHGYYAMNMVTTRGCPYHCNWCAKPIWGQRYHSRAPLHVARELKWLKETYQPDYIWFADDIMGLQPDWWSHFADAVEQKDARIPFKCLSRADLILRNAQDLSALKRSGCDIVWLGAESGSQKILDAMEKGTTVEQIRAAAEHLHAAGIRAGFFLQFGYPGETRQDIESTLQLVRDCRPDDIGMSVSYPLPGTKFHENVRLQLGAKQNWLDSADLDMMYQGPFSTSFYRQLHIVLHKEFRSRRSWEKLRSSITHPRSWRLNNGRELAAIAYRMATLPLARAKLDRLAAKSSDTLESGIHMTLEDAARPSPQPE